MGNDLCNAAQQTQFKKRMNEICNGVQNYQKKDKLQPITFSDHGSARSNKYRDDNNQNDGIKQESGQNFQITKEELNPIINKKGQRQSQPPSSNMLSEFRSEQKLSQPNPFTPTVSQFNQAGSPTRKVKLNLQKLQLYQPITVPFSVIKMLLDKRLVQAIKDENNRFFEKYDNDENSFKLFKQGCYGIVKEGSSEGLFLNSGYYYEGRFGIGKNNEFRPEGKGLYLSCNGKYVGQFSKGKPHGTGKYVQFAYEDDNHQILETVYLGQWSQGQLTHGTIQSALYKYQGQLKQQKPHGQGKLHIKSTNSKYTGQFQCGLFHGHNSLFQNSEYTYSGSFQNGKKHGRGSLLQKSLNGKIKHPEKYEGNWKSDKFFQIIVDGQGK